MWLLGPLLLAVLASDRRMGREANKLKELHTRLGLGDYLYVGMPFHGGRTVVVFDDGSRLVELVTQEDFAVAGTSLMNFQVGGMTHGREEERRGDGVLWECTVDRTSIVIVYVDAQNVPQAHLSIRRSSSYNSSSHQPGTVQVLDFMGPNFKYRDRFDETELRYGKIPEELQDKILSVWLDLRPHLSHSVEELTAAAFGEPNNQVEYDKIKKKWNRDHGVSMGLSDNSEYNRMYYQWRFLEEKSVLDYDEEEDKSGLDREMEEHEEVFSKEGPRLVQELDLLGILSFTEQQPFFRTSHGKLTGSRQASTLRWAWDVSVPDTGYALLGQPDFTLELRMSRPNASWLRKNRIIDPDNPYSLEVKLPRPLLYWRLKDPAGNTVSDAPYETGLFDLIETYTPMRELLAGQDQSLLEDATVVDKETQRRWIVPIQELIGPLKEPSPSRDDQ